MKGKHSQILHPLGIKAAFDAVCGLGAVVTVPLVSGKQGPKERMVNQGTKQAEHLPAASRSSSTPHCISQLHFGRAWASSELLSPPENQSGMTDFSFVPGHHSQHQAGIVPWKFCCPRVGTTSAGIQRPRAERKGGSVTLDLFPS